MMSDGFAKIDRGTIGRGGTVGGWMRGTTWIFSQYRDVS